MPTLRFQETHRYNYPVATTGSDTALTVCLVSNDPYLAFLTQTGFDDEVVYLALGWDFEYFRHPTPPGREVISGMGYNRFTRKIWCSSTTNQYDQVFAFDPETGLEVSSLDLSADTDISSTGGFATNGILFIRSSGPTIELRTMGGFKLAQRDYSGRNIRALTESPWSWTFGDLNTNEIVVIGPFGNEIATAPAPGSPGGLQAIAYNTVSSMPDEPQVWLEGGIIGDPGTIHHPDTPWNPQPWGFRHRLYVANETDQVIYAGYLTEF